jgi:predicted Zn finger-like uncharacterized protein
VPAGWAETGLIMYCRCPHCDTQQKISTKQLRERRALLNCKACGEAFDALPSLSDAKEEVAPQPEQADFAFALGREQKTQPAWMWGIGSGLMLTALLAQVVYFDGQHIYQRPDVYASLKKACRLFNCRLPSVNNPQNWTVSHTGLQHYMGHYLLTAALTNQAEIPQSFPSLRLVLTDFNGDAFAERLFSPGQYTRATSLEANETIQVRLPLTIPADEVGGFSLTAQ